MQEKVKHPGMAKVKANIVSDTQTETTLQAFREAVGEITANIS